eukprot:CAMPEP_0172317596 /NCGR_PEP_ID=MMETSP1058-20130122/32132_1 /TAXON_ID=83371 /ORGANISM="Detonula confervacea, Strain CCMP 353" /LENGTH=986 /DNA_ID=CAMNT_0013032201 /DNA_START=421 /DNA_END=3381 /DNA_ORIENTATION=-
MATAGTPNSNVKVAAGYVLQERLGAGSFATVYKGIRLAEYQHAISNGSRSPPPSSSIVAIKAISRSSKKLTKKVLENLDMEIAILRTYRHPNIVCMHDVQKTDRHFYLVLEYCGGGDLQRLIRTRQKGRLSERLCRRLVSDLAAGLGFLWGKELVHRDIKPQNLLLTGPLPAEDEMDNPPREDAKRALQGMTGDRFMLKIADFGFARHLSGVDLAETMCGSPLYMAPEILSGERYDAKADLWSVGAVLFEMIAGKTPFHGENHLDLLRNIKTKAVRLPANVRVSREFVQLLKLLLNRKPHNRAGFKAFYDASEAFVALGCNGTPVVPSSSNSSETMHLQDQCSGQKIVEREVCAQMNLCAISENEGAGESFYQGTDHGTASLATVATMGIDNHQQLQQVRQPPAGANYVSNMATHTSAPNAMVQVRPDHMIKPEVVTPPLNPVSAPQPPPSLPTGQQGVHRQHGTRPSVFAPLQGSPCVSPFTTPAAVPSPPLFSLGGAPNDGRSLTPPRPGPSMYRNQGGGAFSTVQQHGHSTLVNNQINTLVANRSNSSPKPSSHESHSSDSGFVMVEHSGRRSKPGSGHNSPSTSIGGIAHSPSGSPYNSSNRVTILDARNNMGILGTSPGTGRALVGKMMMGSPAKSSLTPPSASGGGRFNLSPRAALRSGGCLAHIDVLARMLAASEDIGRRAITVAHLGDVRAYLAMGLLVAQREESQLSSMSTGTPMEGVDEERNSDTTKRLLSRKAAAEEDEEDELPFAMTTSSDGGSAENMSGSPSNNMSSNIAKSSENEKPRVHFREALVCYFKTLTMMKGSICAAQKVMKEVEEVAPASNPSSNNKNPYTPLKKRCSASLEWLRGQFSAVLERADAASEQISKLQKVNSSQMEGEEESSICVEELIYTHSLKCGREGAVKQILGHYEEARSCFRSAGLLAETLMMESKVGEDDRSVLEGYVNSFADQIITLDGLIRVEMRKSRASVVHSQGGNAS